MLKESIADLCRIIELYEGVCVVRTKDPDQGILEFWVSPSFMQDFQEIIGAYMSKTHPHQFGFLDTRGIKQRNALFTDSESGKYSRISGSIITDPSSGLKY